eukprot:symbB.v1.2.009707.t1/scaffold610.1/size181618/2
MMLSSACMSEAWAGYKAVEPLLGRGVGGVVLLSRHEDTKFVNDLCVEAMVAMVVQGEPNEEQLKRCRSEGPLKHLTIDEASEGLHLGRLSLLEGDLRAGASDKEVRRFMADLGHRIIGNGQLCARAAGVRRTYMARIGLRQ